MSAEHEPEIHDVMRQLLGEMKGINGRLERMEARQKQIGGSIATLVADENLQKMVTPHTAAKIQVQLFARDHPAAERFFSTPELLETMLLMLPMQDLLLAQRVCLRFKATIDGSVKICRALFFLPEPVTEEGKAVAPRLNPLLTDMSQHRRRRFVFTEATPRPQLNGEKLPLGVFVRFNVVGVGIVHERIDDFWDGAAYNSRGSWRKMLVAQTQGTVHAESIYGTHIGYNCVQLRSAPTIGEMCYSGHEKWTVTFFKVSPASEQEVDGVSDHHLV
ncbi:hypothetical protein KC323_g5958 [Hortaea werneckii]|nr:hypothetical protein KC323_g5958 [Hortaea werneckii]